jgi:hypothetical protein
LNFRGPRIRSMNAILSYEISFIFLRQTHCCCFTLFSKISPGTRLSFTFNRKSMRLAQALVVPNHFLRLQ